MSCAIDFGDEEVDILPRRRERRVEDEDVDRAAVARAFDVAGRLGPEASFAPSRNVGRGRRIVAALGHAVGANLDDGVGVAGERHDAVALRADGDVAGDLSILDEESAAVERVAGDRALDHLDAVHRGRAGRVAGDIAAVGEGNAEPLVIRAAGAEPAPGIDGDTEDFDRADGVRQEAKGGGVCREPGPIGALRGEEIDRRRLLGQRLRGEGGGKEQGDGEGQISGARHGILGPVGGDGAVAEGAHHPAGREP